MKEPFLITVEPFFGPDGKQYQAVWGSLQRIEGELLANPEEPKPFSEEDNEGMFHYRVGGKETAVLIDPGAIYVMVPCPREPPTKRPVDVTTTPEGTTRFTPASVIYIAGLLEEEG